MGARLLPQSYQYPNLSEGADRVGGQLRGNKECPFCGVTISGRVWRKVPKSDARSVEQMVTEPTRQGNALDLILTNIPQLVPRMEITPGLSDHDIVYAEFSIPTHQQSVHS